jgi:hypothetical protein
MSLLLLFSLLAPLLEGPAATRPSAASVAAILLDDKGNPHDRNAVINENLDRAGEVIAEMAKGLGDDATEEYRRIPWIWRVAVNVGKRNDPSQLREVLRVSLPLERDRLRDWQAVVIGGGVINGITIAGDWPGPRVERLLADEPELLKRWKGSLQKSVALADDVKVTRGTRYDAIRMLALLGWDASGPQLRNYLKKGTHAELQMGAVSGCGDIDDPRAAEALIEALPTLDPKNVRLAVNALHRTAERKHLLEKAVAEGRIPAALAKEAGEGDR